MSEVYLLQLCWRVRKHSWDGWGGAAGGMERGRGWADDREGGKGVGGREEERGIGGWGGGRETRGKEGGGGTRCKRRRQSPAPVEGGLIW